MCSIMGCVIYSQVAQRSHNNRVFETKGHMKMFFSQRETCLCVHTQNVKIFVFLHFLECSMSVLHVGNNKLSSLYD